MARSQQIAADVAALLRARNPLLWVKTAEEGRAERYLCEAAAAAGYVPYFWDAHLGVTNMAGKAENIGGQDPGATLTEIMQRAENGRERAAWILRDLSVWLTGMPGASVLRQVRNLARILPGTPRERAQALIVLSTAAEVPADLSSHAAVIEWPLPDRDEIAAFYDAAIGVLPEDEQAASPDGQRDAAIDAAIGLSGEEAQANFGKSLVLLRRIDPVLIAMEKRRVIARERVLEWFDPIPGGLDAVGGLDALKDWLRIRRLAYSPQARAYGLPAPRGALLVGISGCGKSLLSKAIATAWAVPLLRVDLGALKSKYVGESEANLRKAFQVIGAIGRCVVWFDEIEKSLAGATGPSGDSGVAADALGAVLARISEGFTGAEIAALVPDALFAAFADNAREITTNDLLEAARTVVPLSKTAAEKIQRLRDWAKGRARFATASTIPEIGPQKRLRG